MANYFLAIQSSHLAVLSASQDRQHLSHIESGSATARAINSAGLTCPRLGDREQG